MIDTIQIMDDLAGLLRSYTALRTVNIVRYDKFAIEGMVDWSLIYLSKRHGKTGAGIIVELPYASDEQPNAPGPILNWVFPILAVENPTINRGTGGTKIKYDILSQMVMDCLHHYTDDGIGSFAVDRDAVKPVDLEPFKGCLCYRTGFKILSRNEQTNRASGVAIAIASGNCTLSSATSAASIYYTLDGSFPGNADGENNASKLYSAPFAVVSGQILRTVAYKSGLNNSIARKLEVT